MTHGKHRSVRRSAVSFATIAWLLGACGGGTDSATQESASLATDDASASPMLQGSPDPAAAKERLLANANMAVPDAARLVSYTETGVNFEGPPEMASAIVQYEAELEFTADTYFHADHKAGDRVQVYGEIEYLNEGGDWRLMVMGIYPR